MSTPVTATSRRGSQAELLEAIRTANPFFSDRVTDPLGSHIDVPSIHGDKFRGLTRLATTTVQQRIAAGVMVLGGAGVGKSHLLARLAKWSNQQGAPYVYLHNVLASPERVPRHLLRCIMSLLIADRQSYDRSQLYKLLLVAVSKAVKESGLAERASKGKKLPVEECRSAFVRLSDGFQTAADPNVAQVMNVLFSFFKAVNFHPEVAGPTRDHVEATIEWLSGNPVSAEVPQTIGAGCSACELDEDGLSQLSDDHHIKLVLLVLTELAAVIGKPFIVCIDQVDNLDEPQVKALSRFLHALLDQSRNLLLVTSGVRQTMLDFQERGIVSEAAWDRLAYHRIELSRVTGEEARQIILARLEMFFDRFEAVAAIARLREEHDLFPLSVNAFATRFGELAEVRPREVITWARDAWRTEQSDIEKLGERWISAWPHEFDNGSGGEEVVAPTVANVEAVIDAAVQSQIRDAVASRHEHKGSLPPDPDNLTSLIEALLSHCCGEQNGYSLRGVERIEGERPTFHLEVLEHLQNSTKEVRNGVCVVTTRDGRYSTPVLKKLLKPDLGVDRRVLVTDEERAPLPMPPAGKGHYDKLLKMKDGFRHIKLDFRQYAELDSIHNVVRMARVGDLDAPSPDGSRFLISEAQALESLHRLDVFRKQPLLCEFIEEPHHKPPVPRKFEPLNEDDVRSVIMGHLGWRISMSTTEITTAYLDLRDLVEVGFEEAHDQIMTYAKRLAQEKKVVAQPHNDALLLMLA